MVRPSLPAIMSKPPPASANSMSTSTGDNIRNVTYNDQQILQPPQMDNTPLYDMSFMEQAGVYDQANQDWTYAMSAVDATWDSQSSGGRLHGFLEASDTGQATGWSGRGS